jgi:hypothetical protein
MDVDEVVKEKGKVKELKRYQCSLMCLMKMIAWILRGRRSARMSWIKLVLTICALVYFVGSACATAEWISPYFIEWVDEFEEKVDRYHEFTDEIEEEREDDSF